MYTQILFDLDGTLVDPKEGITKSVAYALTKLGIIEKNLDKLIPFIGPPLSESFQKYYKLTDEQTKQAVKWYRERYEKQGMYEVSMYPGVQTLLETLQKNGKKLFIVTSKPTYFARKIIDTLNLNEYFIDIYGATMDIIGEKKTDTLAKVKDLHSAVMVGDREHDILAAKHHGIDSIGVLYGYGSREELEKVVPTKIALNIQELLNILLLDNNQTSLL